MARILAIDYGNKRTGLAVTESIMDELVSLPMFPQLGAGDVERVSSAVLEWCRLGA